MRLYIAEDSGESLGCPECERELWPAYWTEEGLVVGYWSDFAPADGQAGLLVCGNSECTYEEPVTFTHSPVDAVTWNHEETWLCCEDPACWQWPETWLSERIEEVEQLLAETSQPKLQALLALYNYELAEQQERIERWLAEATAKGCPVTFQREGEKLSGLILGSDEESFTLQTPEGEVCVVPKEEVWHLHIQYPRKPTKEREAPNRDEDGHWVGFPLADDRFIVVEGYHLRYGGRTELGDRYVGRCWDAAVAAALRLREVVSGYWEGAFSADEIERFYYRHDYVLMRGYWVEEVSRIEKPPLVWVKTKDAAIAQALDLQPQYAHEGGEFGSWEGDEIFAYWEYLSLAEIEAERWEEEPLAFPPEYD